MDIFVAPIADNMLIGLDFLAHCRAIIDLEKGTLVIGGKHVNVSRAPSNNSICRVTVAKSMPIPPRLMTIVPVTIAEELQENALVQPTLHPDWLENAFNFLDRHFKFCGEKNGKFSIKWASLWRALILGLS